MKTKSKKLNAKNNSETNESIKKEDQVEIIPPIIKEISGIAKTTSAKTDKELLVEALKNKFL